MRGSERTSRPEALLPSHDLPAVLLDPDVGTPTRAGGYGSGMPARPPSGTVTFLFTDIQDSTRLWEEAPAEMATTLPVHDTILRGAIERHGGYVFATGGDGLCAAFSTAADRGCRGDRVPAGAVRRRHHHVRSPDGPAHRGHESIAIGTTWGAR